MPNGAGLLGNSSANQPAVTSSVPGQINKYYVITNSANFLTGGTITYSVVDMALFGNAVFPAPALGNVEVLKKNIAIPGLSNRSEGMIVIPHANGKDSWLITHQNGSADYAATLLNATSYTTGTFTTIVSPSIGNPSPIPVSITASAFVL